VGSAVGPAVGTTVGTGVGIGVGTGVGASVGTGVGGAGVGVGVGSYFLQTSVKPIPTRNRKTVDDTSAVVKYMFPVFRIDGESVQHLVTAYSVVD